MTSSKKIASIFPFLAVVLIVAVSGCTSTGTGGSGPGVVILSWTPELSSVFSEENVDILLKIQNQGDSRAKNVRAEITNIDMNEWGSFFEQEKQLGDLIPADPVSNTPGETKTTQFQNLEAPQLSKGTSFTYEPSIRVSYDYSTTAQKPVTLVDKNELIMLQQQGKSLPSKATTYSSGPLTVDIIMGNYIKTSSNFGSGQTYDIFPVQIKITNTQWGSGGSVTDKGFGGYYSSGWGEYDYPVNVKVIPPSGTSFVYSGYGTDCSSYEFPMDLFQGKEAEITCELEVTNPPTIKTESLIKVELDYRFFTDSTTQVTVQGTKEAGSLF